MTIHFFSFLFLQHFFPFCLLQVTQIHQKQLEFFDKRLLYHQYENCYAPHKLLQFFLYEIKGYLSNRGSKIKKQFWFLHLFKKDKDAPKNFNYNLMKFVIAVNFH